MSFIPKINSTTSPDNYLDQNSSRAINSIGNWITYADAAGVMPVDGIGGSPTVTIARNTVAPLYRPADLKLSKPATNCQGQGWSIPVLFDKAQEAGLISVRMDYSCTSNFVAASLSGQNSDINLWAYDIENSVLIPCTPYQIFTAGANAFQMYTTFQTAFNSKSYRFILHIATTNALAWDFSLCEVQMGRVTASAVSNVSPLIGPAASVITASVTPPTKGTTAYDQVFWRQVGNCMEFTWQYRQTTAGSAGSGVYLFNIPGGYQADLDKILPQDVFTTSAHVGNGFYFDGSINLFLEAYLRTPTQVAFLYFNDTMAVSDLSSSSAGNFGSTALNLSFTARVPIQGWSSTLSVGPYDGRLISSKYGSAVGQNFTTTAAVIDYETKMWDATGAVTTGASWAFKAQQSGYYQFNMAVDLGGVTNYFASVYVNGIYRQRAVAQNNSLSSTFYGGGQLLLTAGDLVDVRINTTTGSATSSADTDVNWFDIFLLTGSVIPRPTDKIAARYMSSVMQLIPSTASTLVDFATLDYDTHGAVTTGFWKFTAPVSCRYSVKAKLAFMSGVAGPADFRIEIYKNGVLYSRDRGDIYFGTFEGMRIIDDIQLIAGDYIQIFLFQATGGNNTLSGDPTECTVAIASL